MRDLVSRIEDGYLIVSEYGHPTHRFEIVDRVPLGYEIWSIGEHMPDGWLPLCRLKAVQEFEGGMSIEPDTLKAIKCEGAQIMMKASIVGLGTLKGVERFISKYDGKHRKEYELKRAKAALPYMKQINWH